MNKNILAVGLVVLIAGLFLTVAFWPIFGVSGSELADQQEENGFEEGESVRVYGTITDIEEIDFFDITILEIDNDLLLWKEGGTDFSEGDSIHGNVVYSELVEGIDRTATWEIEGDLSSKQIIDITFYATLGAGIVIVGVGIIKF
ncbi:MAG: hypothetical protein V5A88_08085 [Candidatus Thermoplasmatota archaeon]